MKRFFSILAVLVFWASAANADQNIYCRAGCTNDGDGTANSCAASGGAAGARNSWTNCIAGVEGATTATSEDLYVYLDDEAGANFTNGTLAAIDAMDQDFAFVRFRPASGAEHSGTFDESLPVLEQNTTSVYPIYINQANVDFDISGLQFLDSAAGDRAAIYVHTTANTQTIIVDHNIFKGGANNSSFPFVIYERNASATLKVTNNIAYDVKSTGNIGGFFWHRAASTAYVYNNTIQNCSNFIYGQAGVSSANWRVSNNIAQDLGAPFYDNNATSNFHTSSDYNWTSSNATSPDDDSLGSNTTKNDNTVAFDNRASDDFHVTGESSTICKANNLYSDATAPVTTDIELQARPSTGNEYIGADTDLADPCTAAGGSWLEKVIPRGLFRGIFRGRFGAIIPWSVADNG